MSIAASDVAADDANALYQAEVAVVAKDEASRDDNLRRALMQVLSRVISSEAMQSKTVGAMLRRPTDYADDFEYLSGQDKSGTDVIHVNFDFDALHQALQRSAIGVWDAERRPDLVVWLWVQDGEGRRLISPQESPEFERVLTTAAAARRLRLIAPLGDLTDQANLTATDVETGNLARIREASWRYDSDYALVGLLKRSGEQTWDAAWHFVGPAGIGEWRVAGLERDAALNNGIDGAFDRLIKLHAQTGRAQTALELEVEGISSMQDADRCGDYLRSLPLVRRADWLKAESNRATWRLTLAGQPEVLKQMLAVSRALRPAESDAGESSTLYRWVP